MKTSRYRIEERASGFVVIDAVYPIGSAIAQRSVPWPTRREAMASAARLVADDERHARADAEDGRSQRRLRQMAKSKKRQKTRAEKKARKKKAMMNPGYQGRYALKKDEQRRGIYRPSPPFYLPPSQIPQTPKEGQAA